MNKFFSLITFFIITFLIYAFYISQFEFQLFNAKNSRSSFFYDYKVVENIHTHLTLGSGTVESIAEESQNARQNFLLFSDVLGGAVIDQDQYKNHIGLLFGEKIIHTKGRQIVYSYEKATDKKIYDLKIESPDLKKGFDTDFLMLSNADGMEVVNLKVLSQKSWEQSKISALWSLLIYPFNARLSLMRLYREPREELKIFDQISQKKQFSMFFGAEASARAIPITNLIMKFPSYERVFSVGSQHLLLTSELTGNMAVDKLAVVSALKKGQSYLAFDELGDPAGFETYVLHGKNKNRLFLGDEFSFSSEQKIFYTLPSEPNIFFEVVLIKNGDRVDHLNTYTGEFKINGPGVYRIQVRLSPKLPLPDATKWLTWIYTNNFYIR